MRPRFALVLAAVALAACGDSGTTVPADGGGARFAITRVEFGSHVEITNVGDAAGSFEGWFLCQRPSYVDVSSGGELAPGESVQVPVSAGYGGLDAADGEMGLYRTDSFASAAAIVSYVEWGEGGHGRSAVAVEAGIWDGVGVKTGGAAAIVAPTGATTAGGWNGEG